MRNLFEGRPDDETDFGRRYGWIVLHEGKPVAELEYVCWDEMSQFWHRYNVRWLEPCRLSNIPYQEWPEIGLTLRNKKHCQVEFRGYLTAIADDGTILLRGPYVPRNLLLT
jgi:hypothetical protein